MSIYLLHPLYNIIFFAIPLALFGISVERANGWGSAWSKDKWYAKSIIKGTRLGDVLTKITKLEPPLNYHLILSYFVFGGVFLLEYIFGTRNIFLVLGSLFITLLVGDLTWFICNWYFNAWKELLKGPRGRIFWHKSWINIYSDKYLPSAYFTWLILGILFIFLAKIFK